MICLMEIKTTKTLQILRREGSGMICLMEIKTAKAIQFLRREGSGMHLWTELYDLWEMAS